MAERLKDMFFTEDSINKFTDAIGQHYPAFDKSRFLELMNDASFEAKKLLDKMRHTTECLHDTLPKSYKEALEILKKAAPHVKGFEAMALPDFVASYGMDDWDLSLPALGHFTKYYSSELAIRPFLDKDPEKGMATMMAWAASAPGIKEDPRSPTEPTKPAFKKCRLFVFFMSMPSITL